MDSFQSVCSYQQAADAGESCGRFHLGLCHQFGTGFDENLDEAADSYESWQVHPVAVGNAFRCRRAQSKARFNPNYFSELRDFWSTTPRSSTPHLAVPPSTGRAAIISDSSHERGEVIGRGATGLVTLEIDPATGKKVAVKRISREYFDEAQFLGEIEVMAAITHPCVLHLIKWSFPIGSAAAEIRTEYASNRSLKDVLEKIDAGLLPPFWTPTGRAILIAGIVLGMRYVHSKGIIHRDLKPANIMINEEGYSLIGDFGTSRFECRANTLTADSGTVNYAAPEMFSEAEICSTKADVFSFGSVIYEILTGSPVFPHDELPFPVMRRLFSGKLPTLPESHGAMMQSLIERCWKRDPGDRPSFDFILSEFDAHPEEIVPGADPSRLSEYIRQILHSESQNRGK
jgi:serine/threonine protein kinase